MVNFENFSNKTESNIDSDQGKFEIMQSAQIDLINRAGGNDVTMEWITANSARFRTLVNDPQNNFIERLANENTREETLDEIQKKLAN
ncbi:MAG: hypothetical protein HZB11_01750 [Candidatus Yonathbacteria bacterium]|nr:hypothetical protein [Candidatus Yonathbacteria bacterium]